MKRKSKQWWSTIPPISNKTTNQLSPSFTEYNKRNHDIWRWKSRSWLQYSHINVARLNWLMGSIPPLSVTGSPTAIHIFFYAYDKKKWTALLPLKITTYYHNNIWQHLYVQCIQIINCFILSCYSVWYVLNILYVRFVLSSLFIKCNSEMKYWQILVIIFIVVLCYIHTT